MSFDRPGLNKPKNLTDTELNEALEHGDLNESDLEVDQIRHEEGQRSPGPVPNEGRRPPRDEDVSTGEQGTPVEPPD